MSDNLTNLAGKISKSSPATRAFALEAAKEIAALQGTQGISNNPAPVPVPPAIPTPVGSFAIASPQFPITKVDSPVSLGLNVNNQVNQTYKDYVITNTGDSGVLLQGSTSGCTLQRFHMSGVDAAERVNYGAHGVYLKAQNCTLEDFYIDGTGHGSHAGSGFSVRMGGNTIRRSYVQNMPFGASYFEHDTVNRGVSFIDGEWHFENNDTAVWVDIDDNPHVVQTFLFQNIHAFGPGRYFFKCNPDTFQGKVEIAGCTINGQLVSSSTVAGVSSDRLSIS